MPKTTDILPIAADIHPPTDDQVPAVNRAASRLRKRPAKIKRDPSERRGRPCVHSLAWWPVGMCARVAEADVRRLRRVAERRGMVVSLIAPDTLFRLA